MGVSREPSVSCRHVRHDGARADRGEGADHVHTQGLLSAPQVPSAWHVRDGLPPYGDMQVPLTVWNAVALAYVATPCWLPKILEQTLTAAADVHWERTVSATGAMATGAAAGRWCDSESRRV